MALADGGRAVTPPRPATILRIIARLNTGGPAIHAVLLTRGLDGGRFRSRLITGTVRAGEGDMAYYARQVGVTPIVIPELGRKVSLRTTLKVLLALYRLMRQERPAIVHTHTTTAGGLGRVAALLSNCAARLAGQPPATLVHTFHGHLFHGYFPPIWSRLLVLAERTLARVTRRIITVSESVKDDLVNRYRICPDAKVTVVPLGLDFDWTASLAAQAGTLRASLGLDAETVTVGVVGRLTDIKNHALFLDAWRRLDRPDVHAVIVGDGELRPVLEESVRESGLEKRVTFTGWERDPAAIYADLDLVALTSRNEGTPAALIEAMAAGRPFVATAVGGVPDLVVGAPIPHGGFREYDNGVLVDADDPQALAAALTYLIARPALRARMGRAGQALVGSRYSKDRLVRDVEQIYTELLSRS